jgi:hypothetical protein
MLSLEVRKIAERLDRFSLEDQQWLLKQLINKINSSSISNQSQSESLPALKTRKKRQFGSAKGLIVMSPDFDEPLEDFKDYM